MQLEERQECVTLYLQLSLSVCSHLSSAILTDTYVYLFSTGHAW